MSDSALKEQLCLCFDSITGLRFYEVVLFCCQELSVSVCLNILRYYNYTSNDVSDGDDRKRMISLLVVILEKVMVLVLVVMVLVMKVLDASIYADSNENSGSGYSEVHLVVVIEIRESGGDGEGTMRLLVVMKKPLVDRWSRLLIRLYW